MPLSKTATDDDGRISPYLNTAAAQPIADGRWNNGEGFPFDVGGVLGDPNPQTAVQHEQTLQAWTNAGLRQEYVGKMQGSPENETTGPLASRTGGYAASFKIAAPQMFDSQGKPWTVVVLSVEQTTGSADPTNGPWDPYIYGGLKNALGLRPTPWPKIEPLVDQYAQTSGIDYHVVGAFMVTRCTGRPLSFAYQRVRQLREIVKAKLAAAPFNRDPSKMRFLVAGGSFGGIVTQAAVLLHPEEFHAGVASGWSPSHRTIPNDQESYRFVTTQLGRDKAGAGYDLGDSTNWSIFNTTIGTDSLSLSIANRLRLAQIQRPMILLVGDEDPVAHGTDTFAPLANAPYDDSGRFNIGTIQGDPDRWLWWVAVGKACHGDGDFGAEWFIEGEPGSPPHHDLTDAVKYLIPFAKKELDGVTTPPPLQVANAFPNSVEPHDHVLHRKGTRVVPAGSQPNLITEASSFKRYGQGTALGNGDSLVVAKKGPNETIASAYAGSAEGVVYRFERVVKGPIEPLEEMAHTTRAGADYALGYGAWALAVGDVDTDSSTYELVVASYRRIGLFRADTLTWIAEADAPFGATGDDPWLYTQPQRLQIAEINASNAGPEIIFFTQHGRVAVLNRSLNVIARHSESGIRDLIVSPVGNQWLTGSAFSKPLVLMSERGHLASLELDSSAADPKNMAKLGAVTQPERGYGARWDLEPVLWTDGQMRIAALHTEEPSTERSIRIFDAQTLDLVAQLGQVKAAVPPPPPDGMPAEPVKPLTLAGGYPEPCMTIAQYGGATYFVVLYSDHLILWPTNGYGGYYVGLKDLGVFAPARLAVSVAAGDMDGVAGDEIVVSTLAGHVVWFKLPELTTMASVPLPVARTTYLDPSGILWDHRTNMTLAATWPMAHKLGTSEIHAIDQVGTWWRIDAAGTPTLVRETGFVETHAMAWGGTQLASQALQVGASSGQSGGTYWRVESPGSTGVPAWTDRGVLTTPYVGLVPVADTWYQLPEIPTFVVKDGFFVFHRGGGVSLSSGVCHAASWSPGFQYTTLYANLVQRLEYDLLAAGGPKALTMWSSTGPSLGVPSGPRPAKPTGSSPGRCLGAELVYWNNQRLQALRVGKVIPGSTVPQVLVSTTGGRVIALDGTSEVIVGQSPDMGFGGLALALGDLIPGTPELEVVAAPLYSPVTAAFDPAGAHLHTFRWVGATWPFPALVDISTPSGVPIGNPLSTTHDFRGYGTSGIAVADLTGDGVPEIIVTTMNGELAVFAQSQGVVTALALDYEMVTSGLGAHNSIVVADLVSPTGKPELYIASSSGIRRFDVVAQQ